VLARYVGTGHTNADCVAGRAEEIEREWTWSRRSLAGSSPVLVGQSRLGTRRGLCAVRRAHPVTLTLLRWVIHINLEV
jgi:hypothetical protein